MKNSIKGSKNVSRNKEFEKGKGIKNINLQVKEGELITLLGPSGCGKTTLLNLIGGQQQRVALARALVLKPKILLLDEPFSNLDVKLKISMREELKHLQKKLKITMIFVTHDQEEAMCISDKIVVMKDGEIIQIGAPEEIKISISSNGKWTIDSKEFMGSFTLIYLKNKTNNEILLSQIFRKDSLKFKVGDSITVDENY